MAAAAFLAVVTAVAAPSRASAHPLGNFTVNRAVAVEVGHGVTIAYVVDMAEIPAFDTIQRIDADADGETEPGELDAYATAACAQAGSGLEIRVDGHRAELRPSGAPRVSFPPGAGGLETLRLECRFTLVADDLADANHELSIADTVDDGHIGWREISAAPADGGTIAASSVPETSLSDYLRRYPDNMLQSPIDVRTGMLTFRAASGASMPAAPEDEGTSGPLTPRQTAADPLASLVNADLSPLVAAGAIALSLGLGALHAASPGHGKTLVAAYLVGARGDARAAVAIGLTVALTHTAGVFVLGLLTLLASEFILPERAIAWLTLASGAIVLVLGGTLVGRQLLALRRSRETEHDHGHTHRHAHGHADDAEDEHVHFDAEESASRPPGRLSSRNAIALGFAGGLVPSSSALIVLLVAITTDRLVFGSLLIVAFGLGMAIVLGGLGLIIAFGRRFLADASPGWLDRPVLRTVGSALPLVAGVSIVATGVFVTVTALPAAWG
ncbi:MAG: nickel/cobalt transporter [Candidatus Limnocylindria bacterium]